MTGFQTVISDIREFNSQHTDMTTQSFHNHSRTAPHHKLTHVTSETSAQTSSFFDMSNRITVLGFFVHTTTSRSTFTSATLASSDQQDYQLYHDTKPLTVLCILQPVFAWCDDCNHTVDLQHVLHAITTLSDCNYTNKWLEPSVCCFWPTIGITTPLLHFNTMTSSPINKYINASLLSLHSLQSVYRQNMSSKQHIISKYIQQ